MAASPELIFKSKDIDDFESEMKGYRNDVWVRLPNGDIYEIFFYDLTRLEQDMGSETYLAKPGLIILNTVNRKSMEYSVLDLWERGYFEHLKPRSSLSEKHFDENI